MKPVAIGEPRPKLLTVMAGGETFGLPIGRVQTTFRIEAVTPIPLGPRAVVGLVNLRGAIIPALSLRRRLKLPDAGVPIGALAVGLDSDQDAFALLVDDVGDVIAVEAATLQPLPPHVDAARAQLTQAFYLLPTGILPVLDVSALMASGLDAPPQARSRAENWSGFTPLSPAGGFADRGAL